MQTPTTVKVGPHTYRVESVAHGILGDGGCLGQTSTDRLVIAVDDGYPRSVRADVLIHELLHALLVPTGLTGAVAERVCLGVGPGLLALLKDNPDLAAWLTEEEE